MKVVLVAGIAVLVVAVLAFSLNAPSPLEESADYSLDLITIPVTAHLITEPSGYYTSFRDEKNILDVFEQVNRIWGQGNVHFQVEKVVVTEVSGEAIPNAINGNYAGLSENVEPGTINVFFTQSLNGINGIALSRIGSALVADYTTVNDFRAASHELGHLLGLRHVPPPNRLMARGRNGEQLTAEEILSARGNALRFLQSI